MNVSQLRARFAKTFPFADNVQTQLWDYLEKDGYVEAALDADLTSGWDELVKAGRRFLKAVSAIAGKEKRTPPGRVSRIDLAPAFPQVEYARAHAISTYVARRAAAWPEVGRFRNDFLGGEPLPPEAAEAFLRSPAIRCLSPMAFVQYKIPFLRHQARFLKDEWMLQIAWADGRCKMPQNAMASHFLEELRYVTDDDQDVHMVMVCRGSVADRLREIGAGLTQRYNIPGPCAVWLVLTHRFSTALPIQVEINTKSSDDFSYRAITLAIDAWVPAKTVLRVYRQAQRFVLKKDNRPPTERSVALAMFVATHGIDAAGKQRPLAALMTQWNQEYSKGYPEWQYADVCRFGRDVARAKQAVLGIPQCAPQRKSRAARSLKR